MKKIIIAAAAVLAAAGCAFAENYTYGMDIAGGAVFDLMEYSDTDSGVKADVLSTAAGFNLKADTFDYFLAEDKLGIYANLGLSFYGPASNTVTISGESTTSDDDYGYVGFELTIGPAFGVNLGSSSTRFQVGGGFHMLIKNCQYNETVLAVSTDYDNTQAWFGFGVDAQFRFLDDHRVSPVVGIMASVDPLCSIKNKTTTGGNTDTKTFSNSDFDSIVRMSVTPYIALGINF